MPETSNSRDRSPRETDNAETVQVNLRVEKDQKEHWEEYLKETHQFSSLSDLIRSAVEAEISDDGQQTSPESPALSSDIQELKKNLERMRKDMSWLREQSQDEVDISDLAQRVFDDLVPLPNPTSVDIPDDIDEDTYLKQRAAVEVLTPDDAEDGVTSYTVEALSNRLGEREGRIEDALEHLKDQFLPVVEVELTEVELLDPEDKQEELEDQLGEVRDEIHYFKEA